jgi:cyclase
MRCKTICAVLALAGLAANAGAQDMRDVPVRTERVADGVYMLVGNGGNIGVSVGEDGVVLIDDQFAPMVPKIEAAVRALSERPIRFVINTHWHGDHTGGNEALGKAGAVIVAHGNVRERMSVEQFNAFTGSPTPASPREALPVVTFEHGVTLHVNGDDLEVIHLPRAHTDGDAVIRWRRANVVHMGDLFFNGTYPFIDVASGGSVNGLVEALDFVLGSVDGAVRIIPGHGPLAGRAELQAYRDMLAAVRDRIAAQIAAGRSQDEVIAARPTADFDAAWGGGFFKPDEWVARLYVDLRRDNAAR